MEARLPLADAPPADPSPATARPAGRLRFVTMSAPVIGAATLVIALLGLSLELRAHGASTFSDVDWLVGLVGALGYAIPGAQVTTRRPGNVVGPLCMGIGAVYALSYFASTYGSYGLEAAPGSLPAANLAQWLGLWIWVLAYGSIPTVLLFVVPDGRLPSPRWRPLLAIGIAGIVAAGLGWATTPYDRRDAPVGTPSDNPFGTSWGPTVRDAAIPMLLIAAVAGLAAVAVRYRRAVGVERDQVSWVLLGALATAALLGVAAVFPYGGAGQYIGAAALLPLPASLGVAVLRHRLWDVDIVLNRSLVYGALVLALLVVYGAVVAAVGLLIGRTSGTPVVAVAAVAAAAHPLYAWIRRAANRLVFGARDEPWSIITTLSDRLRATSGPRTLMEDAAATLVHGLRLGSVSISAGDDTATAGTPGGPAYDVALVHGGKTIGLLRATARPGEQLARTERTLLSDLAPQLAAALQAQTLAADLQQSRQQIVMAREEERRRLRRELHDGIGPTLAAVALELESAQDLAQSQPDKLEPHLDRLAARLNDAVGDIRRVVDDLRPAALDDLGLVGALRAQIDRLMPAGCLGSLASEGPVDSLPAAVDLAVFRIASEAITNAVRHASPSACRVTVSHLGDEVEVKIEDDGAGISADAAPGVGLGSMSERAAELGGTCSVTNHGAGTTVLVRLPLPAGPGGR